MRSEVPHKHIELNSTGAIGDAIALLAVREALDQSGYSADLIAQPFILKLWPPQPRRSLDDGLLVVQKIDVSHYLTAHPHTTDFVPGQRGHLCQWMGRIVSQSLNIELAVSPDMVRIPLTSEEVACGDQIVAEMIAQHDKKPLVLIAPSAGTKNRNLPVQTILDISRNLKDLGTVCLLGPVLDQYKDLNLPILAHRSLREAGAIFLAADCVVTVDSAPLHIAAGVVQGNPGHMNAHPEKLIAVVGSSDPRVVTYTRNQIVKPSNVVCGLAPCGAHGYDTLSEYASRLGQDFFPSGIKKDNSGCALTEYSKIETAACMVAISANEITKTVTKYLRQR